MDEAIEKFASCGSLPEPIACRPGCHFCCFNQPMVTSLEALLIGSHVDEVFSEGDRALLKGKIERIVACTRRMRPDEIFSRRHELPCIFLDHGRCRVYAVRPAICRACTSTSAAHCHSVFEARDFRARLRCYPNIRQILQNVQVRLAERCRALGCRAGHLWLAEAIDAFWRHPRPLEAWHQGQDIFGPGF